MKKIALTVAALFPLITAGCSTPTAHVDVQAADQLPTNTLSTAIDNNASLYYTADEITQLTRCAVHAKQAEFPAQAKPNQTKTFFSKSDFAMDFFKSCATTNMTSEHIDRAAFCMSGQFLAEYIWTARQQGASEKVVRHRLADSPNKAVALVTHEIYNHEAESLDNAQTRLWNDCIHNFRQVNKP